MKTAVLKQSLPHFGLAWIMLSLALGVHVLDEALNDFLSFYNPTALAIREKLPFLPLPVFTFDVWLTGLILAVTILLLLAPLAFRGVKWVRLVSYPFAILMLLNGLAHITVSLYQSRLMPGVYSSPLLLAAAVYLLWSVRHYKSES
ncbi:MAG: hypothetical protein U0Z53_10540 [Blastocatellia bacterium]